MPILRALQIWVQNPLYLVISAQTLFIFIGIQIFHSFNLGWFEVSVSVLFATVTELLLSNKAYFLSNAQFRFFFPASALAAALGIAIFMRAFEPWYFAAAATLAIISKHFIKIDGGHIFNPSNFAITTLAFALPSAVTLEFTQWSNSPYVFFLVAVICFLVAYRAGVLPITLSFYVSYTLLFIPLVTFWPDIFVAHHYGLLGPTLVIFASFMITDPRTTPRRLLQRVLHGVIVALLYFVLEIWGMRYAPFAASFLTATSGNVVRLALRVLPSHLTSVLRVPQIPLSIAAGILFFVSLIVGLPLSRGHVTSLNSSFILFGVDGSALHSCSSTPIYTKQSKTGLEQNEDTEGASWGDYDGDGDDDLFVSNTDGSRLYRNDGSGTFVDITREAGLPTIRASGAVFVDYDNNGTLDLAIAQVRNPPPHIVAYTRPLVFRNTGHGQFVGVTEHLGLGGSNWFLGTGHLSFGDYDGDGFLDLTFTSTGVFWKPLERSQAAFEKSRRDVFYNGYRTMSVRCGVDALQYLDTYPNSLAPDYIRYTREVLAPLSDHLCINYVSSLNLARQTTYGQADMGSPISLIVQIPGDATVYRNTGAAFVEKTDVKNTLRKVIASETHPFSIIYNQPSDFLSGRYYQPLSFDYDGDGLQDIFVATDVGRNVLLKNLDSFQFSDEATGAGLNRFATGMGVDAADFSGDGLPDIAVTNVAHDYLFENQGHGFSTASTYPALSADSIGWGISFLDYDGDGRDDLYIANGIVTEYAPDTSEQNAPTRQLFKTDALYRNVDGMPGNVTGDAICPVPGNGKAVAIADVDRDGDPDIFTGTTGTGNALWLNTMAARSYLAIELHGTWSNRMGVGATVTMISSGRRQTKYEIAGSGFGSQNSPSLLFGLGTSTEPVKVEVQWPSGRRTIDTVELLNRTVTIVER